MRLYDLGAGRLLGHRFLLLTHRGRRFRPLVRRVGAEEAARVLADYEQRNRLIAPLVRAVLSRLAGFRYDGSPQARQRLVETLPLVGFREPMDEGPAAASSV